MPAHVRGLQVDEVGRDQQGVVEIVALEQAAGLRLEGEHGVPWLELGQSLEPLAPVLDEEIGERRVVSAITAITRGLDGLLRREQAADRLHVMADVHDAHRERDRLAARVGGIAVAVPALERKAQCLADVGTEVEPLHEHVGHLAPGGEVVDRPLAGRLLDQLDDPVLLFGAVPGRCERHHVAHDLGGIR